METVRIIVNPASCGGRGRSIADQASVEFLRLGLRHEIVFSRCIEDVSALTRLAVSEGRRLVVGIGGDGLLSEIANGLVGTTTALGIVPAGRGNDIARGLNIPLGVTDACRLIGANAVQTAERARPVDAGQVGDRYFLSVALVGLAAEINRRANQIGRYRFNAVYSLLTVYSVLQNEPREFCIRVGESVRQCYCWLIAIGNCWSSGRGMNLVPGARPDDGILDACIAYGMGRGELLLQAFPRVFSGRHIYLTGVETVKAREFTIAGKEEADVYADGELVGRLPVTFRAVPNALRIVRPE